MLWLCLGFVIGSAFLLYFLVYFLGTDKILITFLKSNEIEFRMKGGTLAKILENVPGYKLEKTTVTFETLDSEGEIIPSQSIEMKVEKFFPLKDGEKKRKHFLGIYWVGLPPYYKILEWTFGWDRFITEGQKKEEESKGRTVEFSEVGDQWISHASEEVSSLYHIYTYPIKVRGIELSGFLTVDIAFNVKIEAVIPIIPVIFLKGKWLTQFTSMFKGIISDHLKSMSLDGFEELDKNNQLGAIICESNKKFIAVTGMKASNVAFIDYKVAEKAATAEKVAELQGKGIIKTAEANAKALMKKVAAEAKAERLRGSVKSEVLNMLLTQANAYPGGVEILREQIKTEAITGFTGSVLSQGATAPLQLTVGADAGENKKISDKKKTASKTKPGKKESDDEKGEV